MKGLVMTEDRFFPADSGWLHEQFGQGAVELSLEDIVSAVRQHLRDFPSHGVNCSCLDPIISYIRRRTTIGTLSERLKDDEMWRAQSGVEWVLHSALRHRS